MTKCAAYETIIPSCPEPGHSGCIQYSNIFALLMCFGSFVESCVYSWAHSGHFMWNCFLESFLSITDLQMNIAAISNGIIATTKTNGNYHMSINSNNSTPDALYSLCPFLDYGICLSYPFQLFTSYSKRISLGPN